MSGSPARAHADQVRAVLQDGAAARSVVAASWRRSMTQYGLDPENHRGPWRMTEAELREARARMEPLIQLAQPSMDRLFQAVGGIGCCVLLTDRNGVPVERRGAPADDAQFRDWASGPARSGARRRRAPTASAPASPSSVRSPSTATSISTPAMPG